MCFPRSANSAAFFAQLRAAKFPQPLWDVMPGARCHELAPELRRIQLWSQRLFEFGPSMKREFCVIPRAWFRCGSSRTSRSRVMISRSVCD
jgi:hypothetical protein